MASAPESAMFTPMSGLIAIVGRPNVGKSALFNRIVRKRIAIVHDQAGVTRDRVMAEAEWQGHPFSVVDTGGIGLTRGEKASDVIQEAALQQVDLALEAAHVILFVVNVQEGIVPLDREVAAKLHATRKPVLVVVNKCDQERAALGTGEFAELGFDRVYPVSAIHGRGTDTLIDDAVSFLPLDPSAPTEAVPEETYDEVAPKEDTRPPRGFPFDDAPARIAIVGRPNVGKSSLINALTGSPRVVVSPIPGTTRDAVDVPFEVDTEGVRQRYILVDTAGVRKARKIEDSLEYFSVSRTKEAITNADIVVLVLDAESGILEQDKKIADIIVEARRACVVVVNKWDLLKDPIREAREKEVERRMARERDRDDREKVLTTLSEFGEWVQEKLFFLDYAPVIFTSAKEGFQLDRMLEAVRYVAAQLKQKIPTSILNRTLNEAIERRQPISTSGRRLKFYYATQVRQAPPTLLLFVNRDDDFNDAYRKYLSAELRKAFGYEGCPIVLVPKPRPKTIETIRRRGSAAPGPRGTTHRIPRNEKTPFKPAPAKPKPSAPVTAAKPGGSRFQPKPPSLSRPPKPGSAPGGNNANAKRSSGNSRKRSTRPATSNKKRAAAAQFRAHSMLKAKNQRKRNDG